jgi:hypothetical protein
MRKLQSIIAKKMPERRHMPVKAMLDEYWQREMPSIPSLPWGAADAGALGQFLKANPDLTTETIRECLMNRLVSEDHAPGERVHIWINSLLRYASGPLDRYKLLKRPANSEATVGMNHPGKAWSEPSPIESIRSRMGGPWFKRVLQRFQEGKPISDLDKDCLREEGFL